MGIRAPTAPTAHRAAVRIVAGHLDHGAAHGLLQPPAPHGRRRAPARARGHRRRPGHHQGRRPSRRSRASTAPSSSATPWPDAPAPPSRPSPTRARSGWDIDRPMVVVVAETDEDDDRSTRDAEEVRFLQQRFARAWTHAVAVRDPRSPVMGFSREVVALIGVPAEAETDRIMRIVGDVRPGRARRRRRWPPQLLRRGLAADHVRGRPAPGLRRGALARSRVGRQMHGDGALTHVDGLGHLPPARAHPRRRGPAPLRRRVAAASWPPTTPPSTPACARP